MAAFYWVIKCDCKTITCSTLCIHTRTHTSHGKYTISRVTHYTILCTHKIMHAFLMNLYIYYQIKSNQINKPWYSFMYLDPLLLSPLYMHKCVCVFVWFIWIYGIFFIDNFCNVSKFGLSTRSHWLVGWRVGYSNGIHMCGQFNRLPFLSLSLSLLLLQLLFLFLFFYLFVRFYCWLYANLHLTNKKVINSLVLHKSKSHTYKRTSSLYTQLFILFIVMFEQIKIIATIMTHQMN